MILDEIAQRPCDGLLWTHGFEGRVSMTSEERDALVAVVRAALAYVNEPYAALLQDLTAQVGSDYQALRAALAPFEERPLGGGV